MERKAIVFLSLFILLIAPVLAFTTATEKIEINTCSGEGDLFLIPDSDDPYTRPILVSFTANDGDEVLIFTTSSADLTAKVNNVEVPLTVEVQDSTKFDVIVYSFPVTDGDTVKVVGTHSDNSAAVQAYLVQDSSNPVF